MGSHRKEYKMEVVDLAEELYCIHRKSFYEISKQLGVAASTLKRWSNRYGWQEKKRHVQCLYAAVGVRAIIGIAELVRKASETGEIDTDALIGILKHAQFRFQRWKFHNSYLAARDEKIDKAALVRSLTDWKSGSARGKRINKAMQPL